MSEIRGYEIRLAYLMGWRMDKDGDRWYLYDMYGHFRGSGFARPIVENTAIPQYHRGGWMSLLDYVMKMGAKYRLAGDEGRHTCHVYYMSWNHSRFRGYGQTMGEAAVMAIVAFLEAHGWTLPWEKPKPSQRLEELWVK